MKKAEVVVVDATPGGVHVWRGPHTKIPEPFPTHLERHVLTGPKTDPQTVEAVVQECRERWRLV